MAANIETMFSVREKPWHYEMTKDKTKILQEAPTSAEAIKLAGLDWSVEKKAVYTGDSIEINGYFANTRNTDNKVLGIVTDRYKVVQNSEAFEFTDNLIGNDVHYETAGSLQGGKKIWLLAKMPETKVAGDVVEPYLCFTNSHDGTGAIKACMTPIRVVCNNTLNLALSTAKRMWSTGHKGNMEAKLAEAKYTLQLAETYMYELDKKADDLANVSVSIKQIATILDELFPVKDTDSDIKKKNVAEAKNEYFKCYNAPDLDKFIGSAWGAINAMADMADHAEPRRNTSNYSENNWGRIIDGHVMVDTFLIKLAQAAKVSV